MIFDSDSDRDSDFETRHLASCRPLSTAELHCVFGEVQAEADAADDFDQTAGAAAEMRAQQAYQAPSVGVELLILRTRFGPQPVIERIARDHFARSFGKHRQQVETQGRQAKFSTHGPDHARRLQVDLQDRIGRRLRIADCGLRIQ